MRHVSRRGRPYARLAAGLPVCFVCLLASSCLALFAWGCAGRPWYCMWCIELHCAVTNWQSGHRNLARIHACMQCNPSAPMSIISFHFISLHFISCHPIPLNFLSRYAAVARRQGAPSRRIPVGAASAHAHTRPHPRGAGTWAHPREVHHYHHGVAAPEPAAHRQKDRTVRACQGRLRCLVTCWWSLAGL